MFNDANANEKNGFLFLRVFVCSCSDNMSLNGTKFEICFILITGQLEPYSLGEHRSQYQINDLKNSGMSQLNEGEEEKKPQIEYC